MNATLARGLIEPLLRCEESLSRQTARAEWLAAKGRCYSVHTDTLEQVELTYKLLYGLSALKED